MFHMTNEARIMVGTDAALDKQPHESGAMFYLGKLQALQYFYRFERPKIYVWARILATLDDTPIACSPKGFNNF